MQSFTVYKHTAPNGKVYIGQTYNLKRRWRSDGSGYKNTPHFWKAIQKYGWDNFTHEIIADDLTAGEASQIEELLICLYDSTNPEKGYNICSGGESVMLGRKHSDETRRKMSENHADFRGQKHPRYGKHPSKETLKKMSESRIGLHAGEKHPFYGRHHSEETKRKISEAHKKRRFKNG